MAKSIYYFLLLLLLLGFLKTGLKKKGVRSGYNYLGQAHPQTLTNFFRIKRKNEADYFYFQMED